MEHFLYCEDLQEFKGNRFDVNDHGLPQSQVVSRLGETTRVH